MLWSVGDFPNAFSPAASLLTFWPLLILAPALERLGGPYGTGCVANAPISRPILILWPAMECSDSPYPGGHVASLPTCGLILVPPLKRLGPLKGQPLLVNAPTCGSLLFLSPATERLALTKANWYAASLPICGPLLISATILKRLGLVRRQGLCNRSGHLCPCSYVCRRGILGTVLMVGVF